MTEKLSRREIPDHLKKYVVNQNYERYTPEDQAVWRYIMRQLKAYLSQHAHPCYVSGLEKTGISIEKIPHISHMNDQLEKFGWGAVPVSGFIPPAAFMEFQALGYLPIASDMRTLDHLLYTPAPDIVHEAAGHAPILVDSGFAGYLRNYAKVAANAIISKQDMEQYQLIRQLSDLKESPQSTPEEIHATELKLQKVTESIKTISEAGLLSRMNWWTAEYGLIGSLTSPKIFGAGLLSSLGEVRNCLSDHVKKIPLSLDCIKYGYDITEPQPQLFVTPDFQVLSQVLNELADTMAFRTGGTPGLQRALEAETVNTIELNSGLQISGVLAQYLKDSNTKKPTFVRFSGPTQLSCRNLQLEGHSKKYHAHGFSSPLGPVKHLNKPCLSQANPQDLKVLGLVVGQKCQLEFESGIVVSGLVKSFTQQNGKLLLVTFTDCTSMLHDQILFDPSWGTFDMAVGTEVVSVFGGAADKKQYGDVEADFIAERVPPRKISKEKQKEYDFFKILRTLRESHPDKKVLGTELVKLINQYRDNFSSNWLIGVELLELFYQTDLDEAFKATICSCLESLKINPQTQRCIEDGAKLAPNLYI